MLGREYVAENSFQESSPVQHYQSPKEYQQQHSLNAMVDSSENCTEVSFGFEPVRNGIKRFKNHPTAEGRYMDSFQEVKSGFWDDTNDKGDKDLFRLHNNRPFLSENWQPPQEQDHFLESTHFSDTIDWKEHDDEFLPETTSNQLMPFATMPKTTIRRHMSDITSESNSIKISLSSSNNSATKMIKKRRQENTDWKLNRPFEEHHIYSDTTIVEQPVLFNDWDSLCTNSVCLDESSNQSISTASGLRFFDDRNKIDISGNPLEGSEPLLKRREVLKIEPEIHKMKSCDDQIIAARPSFDENFEWAGMAITSPDPNNFESNLFGDESISTFFR